MFNNYDHYAVRDLEFAEVELDEPDSPASFTAQQNGEWHKTSTQFTREATIFCAGAITYDLATEKIGHDGDQYYFSRMFKHVSNVLQSADLSIGSLSSVVSDRVPPISIMSRKQLGRHYSVARPEFVTALKSAGFDCLALANPYNLDLGVMGIASTEHHLKENGLVPAGMGKNKYPIFDINGIKVGVASFTLQMNRFREMISTEGADALLSKYDLKRARTEIQALRHRGARFIISFLDCRSIRTPYDLNDRRNFAEELAEAGADYVVCNRPTVVSKYVIKETQDGRSVPIATSLGTFSEGKISESTDVAPLLRLVLSERIDGSIEVKDSFVPLRRFTHYKGASAATAPAQKVYNSSYVEADFKNTKSTLKEKLGPLIKPDSKKRVSVNSGYSPQLSPSEIASALSVQFSPDDREALGDSFQTPVSRVSVRNADLAEGCCAVIAEDTTVQRIADKVSVDTAKAAGATFAIATRPQDGLPTLLVEDPWQAYLLLIKKIQSQYSPFTVAVTGTAGKTTTKDMIGNVLARDRETLHVAGNGNTLTRAGNSVQKLTQSHEAFVQEVHEGTPGSAAAISRLVEPSIAVITSIAEGHLEQMGSIEAIVNGNLDIVDGMPQDGVLVVNDDSELLRDIHPPVRVVRYGTQNEECDFFARDIRTTANGTSFTIVSSEGECECHLRIHGVHNVSNALATFAVGRLSGVEVHHILAGLAEFQPTSERQNLMEYGGYTLLVDTYNSNVLSLTAALDVFNKVELRPGAKRVAVLGDMGEQGDKVEENHTLIGDMIGQMPIDVLICQGEGMRFTAQAAMNAGVETHYFSDTRSVVRATAETIKPGDAVLFKASGASDFKVKVVYPLFGKIV